MVKPKTVYATRKEKRIDFYLRDSDGNSYYLCTQRYCDTLYEYFRYERSIGNLSNRRRRPNRVVQHMLDKLPKYIKYVMKYEAV